VSIRRLRAAVVAGTLLLLGPLAVAASAHVQVDAPEAVQGAYSTITFRVPTEKDSPTTEVEVAFHSDTPFASVMVKPKAGWSAKVTTAAPAAPLKNDDGDVVTEVANRVTWKATGAGIPPEQYDEFEVSAGPFPAKDELTFKVLQGYGDGSTVSWIQTPAAGGDEPEFPAPVLEVAKAGTHDAANVADTPGAVTAAAGDADPGESSGTSTVLSVVALVLGVLALGVAGFAVTRRRS
jgi:uncharacterized protein YcnI